MATANPYQAFFLVGPTATGKTAVAHLLAEQRNAEILSADSMLVYRGMDIGTAKPTAVERRAVRYWGVDVVAPAESFNVARFLVEARQCFQCAAEAGKPVIVVGGTGLYVRALLEGLDELPSLSEERRRHWRGVFDAEGVEGLKRALEARNSRWFAAMADHDNSRRLIRALELVDAGITEPPRSWASGRSAAPITGLAIERKALVARIETRVREMYAAGLLREAEGLMAGEWDPASTAAQAIGYAEAMACLAGKLSQKDAMALTAQRTRQLAKRQMTWFRHQANVAWIPVTPVMSPAEIAARVSAEWEKTGPQGVGGVQGLRG